MPVDPAQAVVVLFELMLDLQDTVDELTRSFIDVTYVAPAKLQEGMIRFADGTRWNPGAGRGYYSYENGGWHKL